MVTGLAILSRVYPPRGRGTAFGVHAAMVYVGASAGPVLGGVLTDVFGWRFFRDEIRGRSEGRFDVVGTVLYATGMFCTMYGLSTLPDLGSAGLTVAGLGVMVMFVWYELRVFSPVLRVRLFFTNRRFARSAYAALLNYGCTAGSVFFVSLYLQSIGQLSPVHAGMVIFFQPLIQAVMTPVAGRVSDRVDPRYIVTGGMLLSMVGVLLLAGLGLELDLQYIMVAQVCIGLGSALFVVPNTNAIMGSVQVSEFSAAAGIVAVMRCDVSGFSGGAAGFDAVLCGAGGGGCAVFLVPRWCGA